MLSLTTTSVVVFDNMKVWENVMRSFFENVASYRILTGNELRILLFCYEKEYRQKDLVNLTGINRSNISKHVNTLLSYGLLMRKCKDSGIFYSVNKKWVLPDVPGQLTLQFSE